MTLFFNIKTLEEAAGTDSKRFLYLLQVYKSGLPKPSETSIMRKMPGTSFILNPDPLFKIKDVDINYIVQYIKLAARRDYWLYKQAGVKSLQLSYFPDVRMEVIKTNPLLKITKTEIFFYYEEKKRK